MFIENLRQGFYNRLIGKRILMIVNYDIDGICASKILQALFKYDRMLYSVVPIMGMVGLKRAYHDHQGDVKYVILINCGGCVDIVELFQPEDDVTFFICDSHRPLDVCNVYSDRQVCILGDPTLEENIPTFESIFCESDTENNECDDNESEEDMEENAVVESDAINVQGILKKKSTSLQKHEQRIIKHRQRHAWEIERDRIMFEYTQFSYYGRSSALLLFELAWKLSKDNMELLWWGIVGITEQLILGKIERSQYVLEIDNIQSHVNRLNNKTNDQSNTCTTKIDFENDLHLVLYRHWSVFESMRYSRYSACCLKLWTLKGEKKLHELLVEMGLPLIHARQTFYSMDLVLRQEFYSMVFKLAEKFGIGDIIYGSFTLHYGYRNRYSAADFVYSLLAILESVQKDKTPEDCFLEALDALGRQHKDIINNGIEAAKQIHQAIFKQVQNSLECHQVHCTGSFFYYILTEENAYFSHPYSLSMLAKFILNGRVALSRNRSYPDLPLIASCLIDAECGLCLLVGIPPIREHSSKNFFGKAFDQAALKCNVTILQDFFETSLIQIRQSDLTRFLDALTVLLA